MDIHLPTRPNIPLELMKYRAWGILVWIALSICILLLTYLLRRIAKVVIAHYRYYQTRQQLIDNLRTTYTQSLHQLEWREFIVAFLSYLERYGSQKKYASLEEVLLQLWVDKVRIDQILLLYYSKRGNENIIERYLKEYVESV